MKEFIEYLTQKIEAGKKDIAGLEAEGRQDDADFAKVRVNIYDVCRTVTNALKERPGFGTAAVRARLDGFSESWGTALEKARVHDDAKNIVVGEIKMEALKDVIAHFPEEES